MSDHGTSPDRNDRTNEGIIVSGGTLNEATLVAGRNNQVTVHHQRGDADGADALSRARADAARLVELLTAVGHELPDEERARVTALMVKEELDEEKPNSSVLRKWLTKLGALVAHVAPLAELVVAVEESVRALGGG